MGSFLFVWGYCVIVLENNFLIIYPFELVFQAVSEKNEQFSAKDAAGRRLFARRCGGQVRDCPAHPGAQCFSGIKTKLTAIL
jgi:hypothetical protein